jgi:hypothetical protein
VMPSLSTKYAAKGCLSIIPMEWLCYIFNNKAVILRKIKDQ